MKTPFSAAPPPTPFRLIRYFSLASLIGVLVLLGVLLFFYRHFALQALQHHEVRDNEAITRIFANTIWHRYTAYVTDASTIPKSQLQQRPEVGQIRKDVTRQMTGLTVVKVKLYNLDGLTVFSSDPRQIGEDKSTNSGFLAAKAGGVASEITFRNRFDAFEQVINDRNLVSSYIPIRTDADAPVEGVMEVYSDVTDYIAEIDQTQWKILAGILGCLSVLYVFLLAIVRRAGAVINSQDAAMRNFHAAMLRHQSLHDSLTGLPNRANFTEQLEKIMQVATNAAHQCAVLSIGLDGFKEINNSVGHAAGDQILIDVARRLQASFLDAEIRARIGGAEFAVALTLGADEPGCQRIADAAETIRRALTAKSYLVNDLNLEISVCIGIAVHPKDGGNVQELLTSADAALHHAKRAGRNESRFYTAEINARALEMLAMENDLRLALKENQFQLHYQPQLDVASGKITGAEALLRWHHPVRGMVSPAQFIPIAEERGLILPIGDWVLREACRQNKAWQSAGLPPITVAVNVSALQFQKKDLVQQVNAVLQDTGLAPHHLELELTESAVMGDAEKTVATMNALKNVGVKMSLDDFGTGYSSLSLLKRLPLDKLKIDQSFVRGLPDDKDDLAISTATIAMGKALQLRIIAEGVETAEQMAVLISQGAEGIQGYWVSKPVPSTDFYRFVEEHNMRSTEQFKIERTGHRLPPDLRVVAAANDR